MSKMEAPFSRAEEVEQARYNAAAHAMQTAVKLTMEAGHAAIAGGELAAEQVETSPKHLRTGVNSSMVDCAAVARLLVDKGIFTRLEYLIAVADQMEAEVELYRPKLDLPDSVTLG